MSGNINESSIAMYSREYPEEHAEILRDRFPQKYFAFAFAFAGAFAYAMAGRERVLGSDEYKCHEFRTGK